MIDGRDLGRIADTVGRHSLRQLSARLWNRSMWRFHTRPLPPLPAAAAHAQLGAGDLGVRALDTGFGSTVPDSGHDAFARPADDVEAANNAQRFRQRGKVLAIRAIGGDRDAHRALVEGLERWLAGRVPHMDVAMVPMNTALRIREWSWVLLLLGRSPLLEPDLVRRMGTSLRSQARRLARHIEYEIPGNHPCFDFAALWMADALLEDRTRSTAGWAELFEQEFARSVQGDGFHVELSTHYHLQMVRLAEEYLALATGSGAAVGPDFLDALHRARRAASLFVLGTDVPLIGDGCHSFLEADLRGDVATLRALAPPYFGSAAPDTVSSRVLKAVSGCSASGAVPDGPPPCAGAAETHWLDDAGYLVCRHKTAASTSLFVLDAGPLGYRRNPGHGHSDLLSLVLYVGGQPILVDPGTLRYANDAEALGYKRAAAHNTAFVDGEEHGDLWRYFRWCRLPERPSLSFTANGSGVSVTAESSEYRRGLDVRHRRHCTLDWCGGSLEIVDVLSCGPGVRRPVGVSYHFAPQCTLVAHPAGDRWRCTVAERRVDVTIRASGEGTRCSLLRETVAPEYGVAVPAPVLRVVATPSPALRVVTRIAWRLPA